MTFVPAEFDREESRRMRHLAAEHLNAADAASAADAMNALFVTLLGSGEDHNHVRDDTRLQSRWKVRDGVISVEANMPLAGDDNARVRRMVQEMGNAIGLPPKEERRGILTWSEKEIGGRLKSVLATEAGSQERFAAVEALPNLPAQRRGSQSRKTR